MRDAEAVLRITRERQERFTIWADIGQSSSGYDSVYIITLKREILFPASPGYGRRLARSAKNAAPYV
jgi:hypothetical protein